MAELQERSLTISGVKVIFPCKPYPSQFGMMDRVIKGLERRQNGLLESPTGSGKSLALLCSALAWQHAQHEKVTREQLIAENGTNNCESCSCGNKEYSPESKPGHSKAQDKQRDGNNSHNPVELSDDDGNGSDDDFKPASKTRTRTQGGSRKHVSIAYENGQEDEASSSTVEKLKCTCGEKSSTSGKKQKVPKIFFGTRTHKQIAQIARELKKTAYHDVRMAILASREHTCIHPEVVRMKNKSEGCREKLDARGPGCKYNDKSKRVFLNQNQLQDTLPTAWDIEDFVRTCKGKKACPYFVTRNIIQGADIIFCPYNYLIDPLVRNSMEIDLKDQIIILDEAHNMEDSSREAGSGSLTTDQITQAIHNLQELLDHNVKFVEHLKLRRMLENVLQFIEDNSRSLSQKDYDQAYKVWSGFDIVVRLKSVGLGPDDFKENKACLAKAMESDENEAEMRGRQNQELKLSSSTLQTLEQLYQVLDYMYRNDLKFVEDYRVAILKTRTFMNNIDTNDMWINSRNRNRASRMMEIHTLNFWCMNPAVAFSDFTPARNVILSSGTLSPMSSFASELGVPFPIQLEANHVIQDKQVWVGAIGQGPSGSTLQAVYKNMETLGFQDELGNLIHKVCMTVPHGVLCFLPSYRALEKFTERWKLTGLWRKISQRKRIMVEPRAANREVFDDMMKAFYSVVNGDTSCDMSEEDEDVCYDDSDIDGALFFAVCRGKVSEGMDFADNNARAVITVGIPYPSIKDLQVKLKREYNDRYRVERGLLSGNEWYEIQAFRALNQALGRCLRHRKDWGALIIVDDRFVRNKDKYCKGLSKWVRPKVQTFENFAQTLDSLSVFTEQMIKEMPVVDADTSFIPSTPGTVHRDSLYRSMDDSTYISSSQVPGSQGNSSYFSPPENPPINLSNFKTPQNSKKTVNPTLTKGTTPGVSPKGVDPSAVQSPVTPSNQQFQQIMDIVNSAEAPKDKPYYIVLNQGLPNEQTFLIEPPGSGKDNKGGNCNTTAQAEKDLLRIAVPSSQKIMTPMASKVASKMTATSVQPAQISKAVTIPLPAYSSAQNSVAASGQVQMINSASTSPKQTVVKNNILSTMNTSQFLLQDQKLLAMLGTQMVVPQPQSLLLVGNQPVSEQKQILLTQPQGLVPVGNTASMGLTQQGLVSLLGNNPVPLNQQMVKHPTIPQLVNPTLNNDTVNNRTPSKGTEADEPNNKFLKFVSLPKVVSTKVATVAPMKPPTKSVPVSDPNSVSDQDKDHHLIKDDAEEISPYTDYKDLESNISEPVSAVKHIDSGNLRDKLIHENSENSKETSDKQRFGTEKEDTKTIQAVDGANARKRPLFKTRKSLSAQNIDTGDNKTLEKEILFDDEDFRTKKQVKKELKLEKSKVDESNSDMKETQKSKLETEINTGKAFNAAGMKTRRKASNSGLDTNKAHIATKCDGEGGDEVTIAHSEAVKNKTRGETKKSVAEKLKQFRRDSVELIDDNVLQEVKTEDNDFVEKSKSPVTSPEDVLRTRRRKSGRKRRSSPLKMKSKRAKGVDFIDEVEEKKENQVADVKPVQCIKCGAIFTKTSDYQKRRRSPSFMKKIWPLNAEILFFPNLETLEGLEVISHKLHGDAELNCYYDNETGCGIQYLSCRGCKQNEKTIGVRVTFCKTDTEFQHNQHS